MKDSDFYRLMLRNSFHNEELIVSKQEVFFLEVLHKLTCLGDYLSLCYYIPMESGYNVRDVIRSPAPPLKRKPKK